MDMSIYIVKSERNEEVSAYTDLPRAKFFAEQLQFLFAQHYCVEELIYKNSGPSFQTVNIVSETRRKNFSVDFKAKIAAYSGSL